MYNNQKVHVGIIAYNEEQSIATVVRDFLAQEMVDKVIVIDNNSKDQTAENAETAGALVVREEKQGYGNACRRALLEASREGDLIILCEGDASFAARDVEKLLSYSHDADMVVGTRTTKELNAKGAKMGLFLLVGNIFVAKVLQIRFWNHVRLTDVGCTFRAIKKDSLHKIIDTLDVGGSYFSPVMIIEALKHELKVIEIPVNYKERIGESKITSTNWKSFKLGLRMLWEVFKR